MFRFLNFDQLLIFISEKNDSEVTQLIMQGPDAGNALSITVFLSSNITTNVYLGSILYKDVDANDAVDFVKKMSNQLGKRNATLS